MAKGYQRHSRGGSFKRQDFGDLGLRSLRDQQQVITNALKQQAARSKEYGQQYGSALKGVAANEQENKEILARLEDQAYQTRRSAIKKRSSTEVDALKGKADEAGKEAKFWSNFSSTYAKQWGDAAQGIREFADLRYGMAEYEKALADGSLDKLIAFRQEAYNKVESDVFKARSAANEAELKNVLHLSTRNNSHAKSMLFWKHYRNTFEARKLALQREGSKEMNGELALPLGVTDAFLFLKQFDINPATPGGKKIIEYAKTQFGLEAQKAEDRKHAMLTEKAIVDDIKVFINDFERYQDPADTTITREQMQIKHSALFTTLSHRYKIEKGVVIKPPTDASGRSLGYNKKDMIIEMAKLVLDHAPPDHELHTNLDLFTKMVFDWSILPDSTGKYEIDKETQQTIRYTKKNAAAIQNEFLPLYKNRQEARTLEENLQIKYEQFTKPRDEFLADMEKNGRTDPTKDNYWKNDWSEGGPVDTLWSKALATGNKEFINWASTEIGFDRKKHPLFARYRLFMHLKSDPSTMKEAQVELAKFTEKERASLGIDPNLYADLSSYRRVTILKQLKEEDKKKILLAKARYDIQGNAKVLDLNAKNTLDEIGFYRDRIFFQLDGTKFVTKDGEMDSDARMAEADRITQEQWDLGLEGIGYFAMKKPLESLGNDEHASWHIGGKFGEDIKAAELKLDDLVEVDAKINSKGLENFIKDEGVILNRTARSILQKVVKGKYTGEIPKNVKNLALYLGWSENETMNYVLDAMGYTLVVPKSPTELLFRPDGKNKYKEKKVVNPDGTVKIEKTITSYIGDPKRYSPRHTGTLLLWNHYAKTLGTFPKLGPYNNPAFEQYKGREELNRIYDDLNSMYAEQAQWEEDIQLGQETPVEVDEAPNMRELMMLPPKEEGGKSRLVRTKMEPSRTAAEVDRNWGEFQEWSSQRSPDSKYPNTYEGWKDWDREQKRLQYEREYGGGRNMFMPGINQNRNPYER